MSGVRGARAGSPSSAVKRLSPVLHRVADVDGIGQGERSEYVHALASVLARKSNHQLDAWPTHVADQIVDVADSLEPTAHARTRTVVTLWPSERHAMIYVEGVEISDGA